MARVTVCDRCGIQLKDDEDFVLSMAMGMVTDRADLCEDCAEELMKALQCKTLKLQGVQCRGCAYYRALALACDHPMMRVHMPPDGYCSRWEKKREEE